MTFPLAFPLPSHHHHTWIKRLTKYVLVAFEMNEFEVFKI